MDDVVAALCSTPVPVPEAPDAVPAAPGLYAWWGRFGALPGISGPKHPTAPLQLLYVGIAPNGSTSPATLRSKVVGNQIRGTTGSSSLLRTFAALIVEQQGWHSRWTTRPVLVNRDELALSDWMAQTLHVSWAEHAAPWTVESAVIAELEPPLNQAENRGHPMHEFVAAARRRWREEAKAAGG
jgi:hypothetical protein